MKMRPRRSTRTDTLLPDTPLFRSHAATLGGVAVLAGDAVEALAQMRSLVAHDLAEAVVAPELLQRHAGGDEGMVVAAEGAVVLAGRPAVVLRLPQHHGERQAHARQQSEERRVGKGCVSQWRSRWAPYT